MTMEDRIRWLLRAALRAEGEGDVRVAETLRRMAREALPASAGTLLACAGVRSGAD